MPDEVQTFGTAADGLSPFGVANPNSQGTKALEGLSVFKVGELSAPQIKYGSFLLRYDVTAYNNDFLFYGLQTSNGDYRIRRVDRNQNQTWSIGAWDDRETLVYE